MKNGTIEQVRQETEYDFPYHYLPALKGDKYTQISYWSWGFRYLSVINFIVDLVTGFKPKRVIDVGCGDGRFLHELGKKIDRNFLLGIDYSKRAIELARIFNPNIKFERRDIVSQPIDDRADVVTIIEVLEHIPIEKIHEFVESLSSLVAEDGYLVLTVPHENRPVEKKHFQHFSVESIRALFASNFEEIKVIYFDRVKSWSLLYLVVNASLAGRGRYFLVTNKRLLAFLYKIYCNNYLLCMREADCSRFGVVFRRKRS